MIIPYTAIARRTSVMVLLVIVVIAGVHSYLVLPRESSPEIVIPLVNVVVTYQGVSPEDMESLVTMPIERKLTGLAGVKKISSSSAEGASSISIEFEADRDIDDALQKVRDKVDQAKPDIPAEADDPQIFEINISQLPVLYLSMTGDIGLAALHELAKDIKDLIEAVPGVLSVQIIGGLEREIQIEVDPNRVAQYGIALADLVALTRLENVNTPGGAMELGEAKYLMRTPGEIKTPEELNHLVVKQGPAGTVYLRDIAVARDSFKDPVTISRLNGKESITLTVSKRSGKNVIELSNAVRDIIKGFNDKLPAGVAAEITMDQSDDIRDMVAELENSILSGLLLVLVILLLFLGFSNAFFVALAIPLSMFLTFVYFNMTSITLNMVVLFSLILVLGMLVDDGIVVVENMYRHMQMGMTRIEAARAGASEVAYPVIGSTITKITAFFPMFFWPGIWGEFMFFLPLTLTVALIASLFVALVVNPALASFFMSRTHRAEQKEQRQRHPILRAYAHLLQAALHWRGVTVTLAVTALFAISVAYFAGAKIEFVPNVEPQQAYIDIEAPEGTSLETSNAIVQQVEAIVAPYKPYIDFIITNVGSQGVSLFGGFSANTSHLSRVTLDFPRLASATKMPSEIIQELRPKFSAITGADVRIQKLEMGPPGGPPINVELCGDDFATLAQLAADIRGHIQDVPGLVNLRDDYNKGKPEVRVIVDREEAWRTGLSTAVIGASVKAAINGQEAGKYREGDEEYDVVVRFPKAFREDLTNLKNMDLINMGGQPIPFSSVASVEMGAGLGGITHINRKRTVSVSAEVAEGLRPPEVLKQVQEKLATFRMPSGYTISYTGANEDQEETQTFLFRAFAVALLLTTLVLVAQFNSVSQALIIMSSVVLSLGGVFLGLILFDMPFGVLMTGIACISLAGIAVNNGIVLIDFTNELRRRGMSTTDALVEAGTIRFRPVMLTSLTTTLGMIPMAIGVNFDFRSMQWIHGGESAAWWGPMAIAVIAGLVFTTVLTLVVVPSLYSFSDSLSALVRRDQAAPSIAGEASPE
ncbi:MAG TPA: efflux RND transporter permease subunit [Candidatus Hydrogenedentes bacterium]|nr:efflux RND transporter permease subunit [Candidatus Hydrogenedentota bacterium]HOS03618.1 efflux RND transporter permease subunit [Candidatus Hydrogenedentota bacterium]